MCPLLGGLLEVCLSSYHGCWRLVGCWLVGWLLVVCCSVRLYVCISVRLYVCMSVCPYADLAKEIWFIAPGIMDVDGWLISGRLVGWLLVVGRWLVIIGYLLSIGWLVGDCWLSLLCPLLGGLLVGCCWSSVVDWWAVVGQPP